MGTRNLTAVYLDGQYKVAQYGQWDGYPEGQGITVLTFLRDKMDLELFKEALRNSSYIPSEELTALWKQYGADENGLVTMEDSDRMMEDHPEFSRNTGAGILEMVQNHSEGMKLQDSIDFAADGLFCEWAWVIDLDAGTLVAKWNLDALPTDEEFLAAFKNDEEEEETPTF